MNRFLRWVGILVVIEAVLLGSLFLTSCTAAEKVGEAKKEKAIAEQKVELLDKRLDHLMTAIQEGAQATHDAIGVINTEIDGLQGDLQEKIAEAEPGSEVWAENVSAFLQNLQADREKWTGILSDANETIQGAESGWDLLEGAIGAAAGFVPGLGVAVPIVRRSRRMFDGLVQSVAQAGPVETRFGSPEAANRVRESMMMVKGLKEAVTASRVRIGDKKIEAVPTK